MARILRLRGFKRALTAATSVLTTVLCFSTISVLIFERDPKPLSMEALHHRMLKRTALLNQTCWKYRDELRYQYSEWFGVKAEWSVLEPLLHVNPDVLVAREQQIAWCKVPKVASTALVHGLLRVTGAGSLIEQGIAGGKLHTALRKMLPPPQPEEDISKYTAFLTVRHPFQRILSAYRERIADRTEVGKFRKFRDMYGLSIIKEHRKVHQPLAYQDIPTFWEFVQYLLSTPAWKYNEHWRPYYLICTPCHHHYQVIIHLETLSEDSRYLVNLTGQPELKPRHVHATRDVIKLANGQKQKIDEFKIAKSVDLDAKGQPQLNKDCLHPQSQLIDKSQSGEMSLKSRQEIEAEFYSNITRRQLHELYRIYIIDFEMFGYDIQPYDSYVMD